MQRVKITRTQHPVGHGGFHSGLIKTEKASSDGRFSTDEPPIMSFSYVYDCGSEKSDAFNSELLLYRSACGGATDVLFISHLHADHINGIDRLQAMAPANTVVVPYLDVTDRLLIALADFERGTASRSSLDYFENPASWWFGRGVKEVIFIQQGGPDDVPPPRDPAPDGPFGDGPRRRRIAVDERGVDKKPASRLARYFSASRANIE